MWYSICACIVSVIGAWHVFKCKKILSDNLLMRGDTVWSPQTCVRCLVWGPQTCVHCYFLLYRTHGSQSQKCAHHCLLLYRVLGLRQATCSLWECSTSMRVSSPVRSPPAWITSQPQLFCLSEVSVLHQPFSQSSVCCIGHSHQAEVHVWHVLCQPLLQQGLYGVLHVGHSHSHVCVCVCLRERITLTFV